MEYKKIINKLEDIRADLADLQTTFHYLQQISNDGDFNSFMKTLEASADKVYNRIAKLQNKLEKNIEKQYQIPLADTLENQQYTAELSTDNRYVTVKDSWGVKLYIIDLLKVCSAKIREVEAERRTKESESESESAAE